MRKTNEKLSEAHYIPADNWTRHILNMNQLQGCLKVFYIPITHNQHSYPMHMHTYLLQEESKIQSEKT